jgi:hypothetical protein
MSAERIEKEAIRSLWLAAVKEVAKEHPETDVPWYLTLSGAEARDIQLLIDEGLLGLTEVRSIQEKDQHKVVAVENSNQAILELQKRLPGLKIKRAPFQNLIHGNDVFSWPEGDDVKYCRAHIVNLDLNDPLRGITCGGEVNFPVLSWIRKLCQLHSRAPRYNWTLCLTLHGEIVWPEEVNTWIKNFFAENLRREPDFATACREFLGEELVNQVTDGAPIDFCTLDREGQQKIIMVMVPKMIAKLVHIEGWKVSTQRNLSYGQEGYAPMVTWIVRFTWSSHGSSQPDALYRTALKDIFSGAGVIAENGKIDIK